MTPFHLFTLVFLLFYSVYGHTQGDEDRNDQKDAPYYREKGDRPKSDDEEKKDTLIKKNAATVGFLHGGGGIVGGSLEFMLNDRVSLQGGMGIFSYGGSLNYHMKPGVATPYLSFSYWHQGLGNSYFQSVLGPSYTYRFNKLVSLELGLGRVLEKGPALKREKDPSEYPPVVLIYSIGLYFPY